MSFKNYLTKRFLLLSVLTAMLYAAVATLYAALGADISYQGAPLSILEMLVKCLHSLLFSAFFAYILHLLYYRLFSFGSCLIPLEILLFSHLLSILGLATVDAAWSVDSLLPYLVSALGELLFEIVILAVFGMVCYFMLRGRKQKQSPITLKKALAFHSPLQGSALLGALLLYVPQLVNTISFDIYYGAPTSAGEWGQLILYYFEDILSTLVLPYLIIFLITVITDKHFQKTKSSENH